MRFLVGCVLLGQLVWAQTAYGNNVNLDGIVRAFHELNYDISFVYQRDGVSEPMRLVHAFHDGRERERLVHLNGQPREVVREDESVIAYFPNRPPMVLDKPPTPTTWTQSLIENLNAKQRFYRIVDAGESRVAGRRALQINVVSLDQQRHGYRLWLDIETNLLLRSDLVDANDRLLEQWQVVSLQILDKVPEESLAVSFKSPAAGIPPSTATTNAKSTAVMPEHSKWQVSWLPEGFEFKQRKWQQTSSQPVEHLLFSDGLAAISVYIGEPLPQGVSFARQVRKGGMVIYEVANAHQHVTIVGDVPAETARKIALSVRAENKPASGGEEM